MKPRKLYYVVAGLLAACLVQTASAQPAGQTNYNWSAGGDKTTWNQPANWVQGVVPPTDGTTFVIDIGTGYPASQTTPVTLGASDWARLNDSFFGPMWGETLNVYGTMTCGFGLFSWGDNFAGESVVNLYTNSLLIAGDTISLGDAWWFSAGPRATMNLRDNAQVGAKYFWLAGHLNLYGGTVNVTNFMGTGTAGAGQWGGPASDATRYANLVNGILILPAAATADVNNWISRGILFAYGKKYQTTDLVINESDVNYPGRTVVSTIPLGGSLVSVHLGNRASMMVGTFQDSPLLGNYPAVTNVDLSYLDPTTVPVPTYGTSDGTVVSVTTAGRLTALKPGTATITATSGVHIASSVVTVTPYTNSLVHRYNFNESSGATAADSVGGPAWDGTLNGGATFGSGVVTLDGSSGYVQFPAGILTNRDAVTIEAWANIVSTPTTSNAWLFAFGDQNAAASPEGRNYIGFIPNTAAANAAALFGAGDPGFIGEQDAVASLVGGGVTNYLGNVHVVCVYHPYAGYDSLYTNGVLAAVNNAVTHPLALTLGSDPLNALGASLYAADPFLAGSIDEFRIYDGALTAAQIAANQALGPGQIIGTSMAVSLSASISGGNVLIQWPTTAALVDVMTSPVLGAGATWTSVNRPLTLVGGNYQMTVPAAGTAQYFRLQQY